MSAPMIEESLPTKTTDETSSVIAPEKRKEELGVTESYISPAYARKNPSTGRFRVRSSRRRHLCNICEQNQKDLVCVPCQHIFCRQCILKHLEKPNATGEYTCPTCRRRYSTRPALQPCSHQHLFTEGASPVELSTPHIFLQGQLKRQKHLEDTSTTSHSNEQSGESVSGPEKSRHSGSELTGIVRTVEEDGFLKFHKASLKRMIEQCGESMSKAASHTNHWIIRKDAREYITWPEFTSVSCNDLFKAHDFRTLIRTVIRTVMTHGVAGIGKTYSVHKFILDWADGKENEDVDFVFMFPFWKLNLVKDFSCSLHQLLLNFHPEFGNIADLKRFDDSKIVVIFDGLDESQLHLDFQNNQMLCDVSEISSIDTIITNVITGSLLPFAKVWITSCGSSTNQIPSWYINRETEILPLSDSQMEECVKEILNDITGTSSILHQIKLSKSLHAICHIPALCSIAVSVFKNMLEQGESRMIQTCTELYSHFLRSQMKTDAEAKSSSVHIEGEKMVDGKPQRSRREMILRFSELALRQLMENSFTFSEQDLRYCEIDMAETDSILGVLFRQRSFQTEINPGKSEFFQENVFCFKHRGIQEFLAAFFVFYAYNNKNMDVLKHVLEGNFRIQAEDVSLDTLLRSAVDNMLERKSGHQYFLRFLLGISLESNQILLQSLLTDSCDRSGTTESILKYIKDLGKQADVSMDRCIDLLHCQIEMQDPSVIEDIESLLRSQREFSLSHWSEISTLIQMSGGILGEFSLQKCHHSEHQSVLSMFVNCCRKAQLSNCGLYDDSCVMVASALQQPHSALRELDMSRNRLQDSRVKQLCSGLKSPNCKLEILRISNCGLSDDSCVMVASALQQPHSALRELDMSRNRLRNSGAELGSALKSPNCRLEILRISNCDLSVDSCVMVASALQQPHSALRELDMSGNDLRDSGVEQLCSGLQSLNCKLEILRLSNCRLSDDSCVMVASALQQPHSALRELDMSGNDLGDSGVKQLCSGLKSPNCKLEILRLSGCHITNTSCWTLNSALGSDLLCLRELDVSLNDLEESGVKLLTERLEDPKCKLEALKTERSLAPPLSGSLLSSPSHFPTLGESSAYYDLPFQPIMDSSWTEASLPGPESYSGSSACNQIPVFMDGFMYSSSDLFGALSIDSKDDDDDDDESDAESSGAPGPSGIMLPQTSIPPQPPRHFLGQPPSEGKREDDFKAEGGECKGNVEVFTPETSASLERTTYRFSCSSEGVYQCCYTGLIFKTATAAEVQYHTAPWDYKKLEQEGLVAAGPLFKMKGLQGTVRQLGFPHCHIISSDETSSLAIIHVTDSKFEILQPLRISDTHVFLNITGFCKFGLAQERSKKEEKALVILFLNKNTSQLKVLLMPKNVDLFEICHKRRTLPETRTEIYIDNPPACNLIPDEEYSLTCNPKGHIVVPQGTFDDSHQHYCPTFQVVLPKMEPIHLHLRNTGDDCVWYTYINLPAYQRSETSVGLDTMLSSPYTPPGQDFFHRHKAALETRLGLLAPILTDLESCGVLNSLERDVVTSKASKAEQNHTLLVMIENKGGHAQEEFYRILKQWDKYLVKNLERPHDYMTSSYSPQCRIS
ncbi:NACHT, LRR and PYD domains-containing protein 5-like isoform X2 [Sardina pilchardus]|uniref:NACHT, LRR and PYD domains-containing protein 5-like isoform X2 n=1 Tax=Sardina pilchardus TaxID=27697 RepID=UPI002E119927